MSKLSGVSFSSADVEHFIGMACDLPVPPSGIEPRAGRIILPYQGWDFTDLQRACPEGYPQESERWPQIQAGTKPADGFYEIAFPFPKTHKRRWYMMQSVVERSGLDGGGWSLCPLIILETALLLLHRSGDDYAKMSDADYAILCSEYDEYPYSSPCFCIHLVGAHSACSYEVKETPDCDDEDCGVCANHPFERINGESYCPSSAVGCRPLV